MKTKILSMCLTIAMATALVGCGQNASKDSAPAAATSESSSDSADAGGESGVTGEKRTLSLFAGSIPENTPTGVGLAAMADYINENSNGTLEVLNILGIHRQRSIRIFTYGDLAVDS